MTQLENSVNHLIGRRMKALRRKQNLSQDDLANLLGFNDRQTVSAIENGSRQVKAHELLQIAAKLDTPVDYLFDPYQLGGEAKFSWRHTDATPTQLQEYENFAGRWVATYRELKSQIGLDSRIVRPSLRLTRESSFEEAIDAGERFSQDYELGDIPAERLANVMEDELHILVLTVKTSECISGAACRLPDLDAVLIAHHEVEGRRSFNLAHELFHILTWDAMPPEYAEDSVDTGGNRVEQLANNFAAALLMPQETLARYGSWQNLNDGALIKKLNQIATELQVTSSALRWRLLHLGELDSANARGIPKASLQNNGGRTSSSDRPLLFSRPFFEVLTLALKQGRVSTRWAATLLDVTIDDLPNLFATHGIKYVTEL